MKNSTILSFAFLLMAILSTTPGKAAFPIKEQAATIAQTTLPAETPSLAVPIQGTENQMQMTTQKISHERSSAVIPPLLYVVMAIFFLGWLAIGINDDWEGASWLISLLLYIILWLPGFIYTLLVMGKYY